MITSALSTSTSEISRRPSTITTKYVSVKLNLQNPLFVVLQYKSFKPGLKEMQRQQMEKTPKLGMARKANRSLKECPPLADLDSNQLSQRTLVETKLMHYWTRFHLIFSRRKLKAMKRNHMLTLLFGQSWNI